MDYLWLYFVVWYLTGSGGFIFLWTSTSDFTTDEIPATVLTGLLGPVVLLVVLLHYTDRDNKPAKILFKKRT